MDLERLETLLRAGDPCIWLPTRDEPHALEVVRSAVMGGSRPMLLWTAVRGLCDGLVEGAGVVRGTENAAAALLSFTERREPTVVVCIDLAPHLADARVLRALREAIMHAARSRSTVVLIDHESELPEVVRAMATLVELSLPDEAEVRELVLRALRRVHRDRPIELDLKKSDFDALARNLRGLTRSQVERLVAEVASADSRFDSSDIDGVIAGKRRLVGGDGLLEFVRAPASMAEIGGMARLKEWLAHRRTALEPAAAAFGLTPPRGVLLLGVQGAGKSLCAKAVATAWRRPLLRLDPGVLFDKYIGESERRLREALRRAELMAPIVLWIDEIEKGFASAASQSTDGGLSRRMFGTLLTWMQEHREPVFLVATANDITALPPELLRKGRFDEIFFVDLPGVAGRRAIFEIHLRARRREPEKFDLDALVAASEGYSGAEIEQAVIAALHEVFAASGGSGELKTEHVVAALEGSPPISVTMREQVSAARLWARGRCVPAE